MQPGKFNVLMDLQWGSCGKGKVMPWLVRERKVGAVSGSNRPNAGHTARVNGKDYVFKALPSGALFCPKVFVSPASAFWPKQLAKEINMCPSPPQLVMHDLAQLVTDVDVSAEQATLRHISSTLQGAGSSLVAKLQRYPEFVVFAKTVYPTFNATDFAELARIATRQNTMLHEVSQGWALSLDYGHSYPYVTSRNCGVAAALDQMGVPPAMLGDVYGVFRPYPIRVGSLADSSSGPTYSDSHEISWADVTKAARAPHSLQEMTTVTERVRRVFTFSEIGLRHAIECNGVTKLILNFAQQLDWDQFRLRSELTPQVHSFVEHIQELYNIPVVAVGTGPDIDDMVTLS